VKKLNVRKIGILVLCCIGVAGILISLSFATSRQKATRSESLSINIDNNTEEEAFISEDDIKAFFKDRRDKILKTKVGDIQVNDLEKALNTHPAIENAEVSVDVNGDVEVDIRQRHPIVRVFNQDGESYYIDQEARLMPLSNNYTARVLVANGYINEPYGNRSMFSMIDIGRHKVLSEVSVLDDLYNLGMYISADSLLSSLIVQIGVTKENEFELYPAIGNHKIVFGDGKDIEEKFEKLKLFYREGLTKTDSWNKYSAINLKYKNQVVCTKK